MATLNSQRVYDIILDGKTMETTQHGGVIFKICLVNMVNVDVFLIERNTIFMWCLNIARVTIQDFFDHFTMFQAGELWSFDIVRIFQVGEILYIIYDRLNHCFIQGVFSSILDPISARWIMLSMITYDPDFCGCKKG